MNKFTNCFTTLLTIGVFSVSVYAAEPIQHDTEHYILLDQYAEKWASEDKAVDQTLADLRARNNGKTPNIIYILIDDVGFGEFGLPLLNNVRGYKTPNINEFATQGMSFSRMYSEPSCTPDPRCISDRATADSQSYA